MAAKAPKAKSSATGWLRRFGLAALGISAASAIAVGAINIANSTPAETGANSTIDSYVEFNPGSVTNQTAIHPDRDFTNGQADGTWEAWIYPTSLSGRQIFMGKEENYLFGLEGGTPLVIFNNGNSWKERFSYSKSVPVNAWSHVAIVKIGQRAIYYINGDVAGDWSDAAFPFLDGPNMGAPDPTLYNSFYIGRRENGEKFSGRMDEVRVWNDVRSQAEIRNNMHVKVAGGSQGLVGYWDFNEPSGSLVYDRSNAGANLRLVTVTMTNGRLSATAHWDAAREDVKSVSSLANGQTVIRFTRTYLPGAGTWTAPANISNFGVLAVGGGGGGGYDGGSGGGGGELRQESSQPVTAGGSITVRVGQGGSGSNIFFGVGSQGQATIVSGAGLDYQANGGGLGDGWQSTVVGSGGSGGRGGAGSNGASGGLGPRDCVPTGIVYIGDPGSNGPTSSIGVTSATNYGGGGGGGLGAQTENQGSSVQGAAGGAGGGGRGSSYKEIHPNRAPIDGASPGQRGTPSTGGGGGAGSACDAFVSGPGAAGADGWNQRTAGGDGGSGLVIISYTPANDLAWQGESALQRSSTTIPPRFYANSTPVPTANNQAFTAEAWVYHDERSGDQAIFGGGQALNTVADRFYLGVDASGSMRARVGGLVLNPVAAATIPTGRWTHVAATVTATDTVVSFWIDGTLVHTSPNLGTRNTVGSFFSVGDSNTAAEVWRGQIDQVKIWESVLNEAQIRESMHSYQKGAIGTGSIPNATLRAHYDFNEYIEGVEPNRAGTNTAYNLISSNSGSEYVDNRIIETSTAYDLQNVVKFYRSYLTANGGWIPTANITRFKALVVGGGGAGGWAINAAAGGGGGGEAIETTVNSAGAVMPVTVGQGGVSSPITQVSSAGQPSQLRFSPGSSLEARGGGQGSGRSGGTGTAAGGTPSFTGGGGSARNTATSGATGASFNGGTAFACNVPGCEDTQAGGGGGGATENGKNASSGIPGNGGSGFLSRVSGGDQLYGVGGQGGKRTNTGTAAQTVTAGGVAGGRDSIGTSALANTGGGGGGAGDLSNISRQGGSGGSGVVILSWGPVLEVARTPATSRVGSAFAQPIQIHLRDSTGANNLENSGVVITVSAPSGVLRQFNSDNTSQPVTSATATTNDSGLATFEGLGFESSVTSAQTLTFTSDSYVGTTLSVEPSFAASTVNITSSGTTSGIFVNGVFESNTTSAANIVNTDLQTAMASGSVLVETTGDITVEASVVSPTADSDLTLKARGNINLNTDQRIQTNGGDVVIWSDSDSTGGGVIRLLNGSEICTVSGTAGPSGACSTITTGGGDIILGGGAADPNNSARPGGFAAGYGGTYNTSGTTTTTGVQIGTMGNLGGARLYSAGGSLRILGSSTDDDTLSRKMGVDVVAGSILNAGSGQILVEGTTRSPNSNAARPVTLDTNSNGDGITITSTNTSSSAVVIRSYASGSGATTHSGLGARVARVNSAGGFVVQADRINTELAINFNVAGAVRIGPFDSTLLNGGTDTGTFTFSSGHSFTQNPSSITIGSSTNTSPMTISSNLQTTSGNIELLTSDAISKTTATLNAAADVVIDSRESTVNTGTGTISAGRNIDIDASSSVTTGGTISTSGGALTIDADSAAINSGSNLLGTSGSTIRIKTTGAITLDTAVVQTNGPGAAGTGGQISIWSDSDGNDVGNIMSLNTLCVNTIGSCSTASATGGADIVIGGGSVADSSGFFPAGGAPAGTSAGLFGIRISNAHGADRTKIWSGGGDISIASKTSTASMIYGQFWHGGTNVNSGIGQVRVTNFAGTTPASTIQTYGIFLASSSHPITVTSAKPSGDAIQFISSLSNTANRSQPILFWDGSDSVRNTISATGGGNIYFEGNASGTQAGTYSFEISNSDIIASSGNITLKGNRGVLLNSIDAGSTNFGATASGSASGNIVFEGNRFFSHSTSWALRMRTSGGLTIRPLAGGSFNEAITFPRSEISLIGLSGLTVGGAGNTANITASSSNAGSSSSIAGNVVYTGGAITMNYPVTTSSGGNITITASGVYSGTGALSAAGAVRIDSGSTTALNANITGGAQGILVKSVGRITTSAGTSASPRKLETSSGDITLWTNTTGTNGGVTFNNWLLIDSDKDSSGTGGDITIGGGEASSNTSRPAGNAATSSAANAVELGVSNGEGVVRILAGSGAISIKAETTSTSSVSGIWFAGGVKIIGGTVELYGKTTGNTNTGTVAAGVYHYRDTTAKTVIEASDTYDTRREAIIITAESVAAPYAMMLGNQNTTNARFDDFTIRTTGNLADIKIAGNSGNSSGRGVWMAGALMETYTGNVLMDSPSNRVVFSRSQSGRQVTYRPTEVGFGGDITIRSLGRDTESAGKFDVQTAGNFSFIPPTGQSFYTAQIFPLAGSSFSVGGLVVGSTANTASLTQGAAIQSSGDVKYLGGAQTSNFNITTTNSGNIEFYPTTTFTKSTNIFSSAGGILVGTATAPATSVTLSTSTLTAGGDVKVFSSGTFNQTAEVAASGKVELVSTAGEVRIENNISAGAGGVLARATSHISSSGGTETSPRTVTTSGSAITFHSDSDANDDGYIHISNFTRLDTGVGAGDITLSGGADVSTGFAAVTAPSTHAGGVHFGARTQTAAQGNSDGIRLLAGTGSVNVRGSAAGGTSNRGITLQLSSTDAAGRKNEISGRQIRFVGQAPGSGTAVGVDIGATGSQAANASEALLRAAESIVIFGTSSTEVDGVRVLGQTLLEADEIQITGQGQRSPVLITGSAKLRAGELGANITALKTTTSRTENPVIQPASFESQGPVEFSYENNGPIASELTLAATFDVEDEDVTVRADRVSLSGSIDAGTGVVTLAPFTAGRNITLGSSDSSALDLDSDELGRITAQTLRLTTTGNVNVNGSFTLDPAKVSNLAIRAGGDVTGAAGVVITVANLGIDAGGTISFPGNQAASVIALAGTAVSYTQTADYSVAAVDGIDPEFGYGVRFAIANVPVEGTLDRFMAVAFNPPPTVTIRDRFDNTLEVNNLSSADYAVTVTFNLATTGTGTPTLDGATPTQSGGTFTFDSLRIIGGTGTGTFTYSATRLGTSLAENSQFQDGSDFTTQASPTFTTSTYNIQAGEPASIALTFGPDPDDPNRFTAAAGKIGLAPTATLKDVRRQHDCLWHSRKRDDNSLDSWRRRRACLG
jgi:hypothetical protein